MGQITTEYGCKVRSTGHCAESGSSPPLDKRIQAALELQVEDILREDAVLAAEVARILEEGKAAGTTIIAAGERSVAAQTIEGSTIIIGDQHRVKA